MSRICTILSCPARGAVRDGSSPPQPDDGAPATGGRRGRPSSAFRLSLPDQVRQKAEEARALDRTRKLALLLRRHRSNAAWNDLASLRDVPLQQLDVLVVDLRRVRPGERTGLAAAEERP